MAGQLRSERLPPRARGEGRAWAGRAPGERARPLVTGRSLPSRLGHGRWAERRSGLPGAGAAPAGSRGFGAPAARVWALGPAGRRALPHRLHLLVLTRCAATGVCRPPGLGPPLPTTYWRPLVGAGLALRPCLRFQPRLLVSGHQNQASAPGKSPGLPPRPRLVSSACDLGRGALGPDERENEWPRSCWG